MNTKLKPIEIVYMALDEIKPYWKNPRINDKTVDALVAAIPVIGFNVPIVVDKDMVIIKGHARYSAAVRLHMEAVPCIISDNDEQTNKLDRIADNKVFELSTWDYTKMARVDPEILDVKQETRLKRPAQKYTVVCPYCGDTIEVVL